MKLPEFIAPLPELRKPVATPRRCNGRVHKVIRRRQDSPAPVGAIARDGALGQLNRGSEMKTIPMHKRSGLRAITASICLALATQVAHGADHLSQERTGLFSGILLGAVMGGPPGAVIGAIGGGLAGRSMAEHAAAQERQSQVEALQVQLRQADARVAAARASRARTLVASAAALTGSAAGARLALESSVQFRTGSAELERHYEGQLRTLAALALQFPGAQVHLIGYADSRGPASLNQRLSADRVQAVRAVLVNGGVEPGRIGVRALGESEPLYEAVDPEGRDFERRVLIRIDAGGSQT